MRRRVFALLVTLTCLLLASTAWSQKLEIAKKTLPNGLEVIVLPSSTVPIATIEICVKNGAFTEPPEFNGLSHLYEHMFFKGNAVIPNQEAYLRRMRQLGIVFNGTTSTERVNYYFTLPSDNLEAGLEFMKDAITTPKFEQQEFEREKKVVLGEVDRNESSPYYWFGQEMKKRIWFAHPTRKDPLGDRNSIETATIKKMETMKEIYYVPNNAALVVSGDVRPENVFSLVETIFKSWKRGKDPFEVKPVPPHPNLRDKSYFILNKEVQVPYVSFMWHGPRVLEDPRATHAADVLSYIISQPTSKFQKNLVESGLTLGAGISYYTQRHTGPISYSAQVPPEKLQEAIPALLREVEKLADPEYFTDEQLESAKTILAIQDLYGREEMSSFAHTVSFWWAVAGLSYYENYVDDLKSITRADIARYVKNYVINKPYVMGVMMTKDAQTSANFSEEVMKNLAETATSTDGME